MNDMKHREELAKSSMQNLIEGLHIQQRNGVLGISKLLMWRAQDPVVINGNEVLEVVHDLLPGDKILILDSRKFVGFVAKELRVLNECDLGSVRGNGAVLMLMSTTLQLFLENEWIYQKPRVWRNYKLSF